MDSGEQIYSHGLCCTNDVHSARGQDMYKICTSDSIQKYIGGKVKLIIKNNMLGVIKLKTFTKVGLKELHPESPTWWAENREIQWVQEDL